MAEYIPFDPAAEVLGKSLLGVLNGVPTELRDQAFARLAQEGVRDPQPAAYYPQAAYLSWFRSMSLAHGDAQIRHLGREVIRTSVFPPDIKDFKRALLTLDIAYHLNHRNGEIGLYVWRGNHGNEGELHCQNPYPCEFDQGILEGLAEKFLPGGMATLKLAHQPGTGCRKRGADACIYRLAW